VITLNDELDDDLFSPAAIADPYTQLGKLRSLDPVHWSPQLNAWVVTRYDDVAWVCRQPHLFSSAIFLGDKPVFPPIAPEDEAEAAYVRANLRGRLTQTDPPEHRSKRAALQPYFTSAAIERWREIIRSATASLLAPAEERGAMDVMADLAVPLPLNVISEMMAIPPADRPWVRSVAERLLIGPRTSPNRMRDLAQAMREMYAYVEPLAEERRSHPGDDVISLLVRAETDGIFTRDSMMQNVILMIVAGHETTMNLIANGIVAFARHPEQWDRLRADPDRLVASAVEECLRYDPPVKSIERVATSDVQLRDKIIRAGDRVRWFISSANRDPERYDDPDAFDITRPPVPNLAFGHGIHLCLGASLARLEGQEVFTALAARFGRLDITTDPIEYAPAVDLRSIKSLELRW